MAGWKNLIVKSFYLCLFFRVVKNTIVEKVWFLSNCVKISYVNQNGYALISIHCLSPVENSVDNVENFRITPAFPVFFQGVPFCNYWIKVCIKPLYIRECMCYGNAV